MCHIENTDIWSWRDLRGHTSDREPGHRASWGLRHDWSSKIPTQFSVCSDPDPGSVAGFE